MLSDLAVTREALDMVTTKPWSRVDVGSREGAPVRKDTFRSWGTSEGEEVGSRSGGPVRKPTYTGWCSDQ
jgi:hypothetical protein